MPWIGPHIKRRLLGRETKTLPRLHTIRKIAEILASENGCSSRYEEYALLVLQLFSASEKQIGELLSRRLSDEPRDFHIALIVAAVFTSHASIVTTVADVEFSPLYHIRDTSLGHPFDIAIKTANYGILDLLLKTFKCPELALTTAIQHGDVQMVRYMLAREHNPPDPWKLFDTNPSKRLAFNLRMFRCCYLRTPNVVVFKTMVLELRSRNLAKPVKQLLTSLLVNAAGSGWSNMAKHLILLGARVESRKQSGWRSPLWRACEGDHEQVVQLLLDSGAKPGQQEFEVATKYGHAATLKILLESQTVNNISSVKNCLYLAARKGLLDIVSLLLDFSADSNNGETAPLIGAVEAEHKAIFRLLVQRGADVPNILPEARKRAEVEGLDSMSDFLDEEQASESSPAGNIVDEV